MPDRDGLSPALKIRIATGKESRATALRTFRSLVGQVRGQPGCLSCHLLEDVHEPGDLTFTARWSSVRDLERYVRSPGSRRLLAAIDLAARRPQVEVETTTGVRGLDYFEELLNEVIAPPAADEG